MSADDLDRRRYRTMPDVYNRVEDSTHSHLRLKRT